MVHTNIHRYENWIFDWSGTLVDDLTMVLDATNHVLGQYTRPRLSRDEFREHFRLPYSGFYQELLPGVPLDELEGHFRKGFADSEASGVTTPLLPHAVDFLQHLSNANRRMFILSSMDAPSFERHSRELNVDHFFEATYAGVLDKREQIHLMLATHGLDPAETVFLGDMQHDIDTARHGGVASIALLTGYQSAGQLEKSSPDLLAKDLSEVKSLLVSPQNPTP